MFRHPAWAAGTYSSGPPAAKTVGTNSTGGFHQRDESPCNMFKQMYTILIFASSVPVERLLLVGEPLHEGADVRARPRRPAGAARPVAVLKM